MGTFLIIVGIIVFIVIVAGASGSKGVKNKTIEEEKPEKVTLEYEDSETNTPHYIFYSIASEYFNGFDNLTKENAEGYPDFYQISYSIFDKYRKMIDIKVLTVDSDYIPPNVKEKKELKIDQSAEQVLPVRKVLETFAKDCQEAHVFVTHAEFHHRDILYANYYKADMELPFPKSKSIDIMEKAKSWVGIPKESGRGYKIPSFNECLGVAIAGSTLAVSSRRQIGSEEKAFTLPKIYFEWIDKK